MRAAALLLIAGICAGTGVSQAADAPAHLACSGDGAHRRFELPAAGRVLGFHVDAPAWVEIRESGQKIAIAGTGAGTHVIDIRLPLRFGYHWLRAESGSQFHVRRVESDTAAGAIEVRMHCDAADAVRERMAWFEAAGRIGAALASEADPEGAARQVGHARALIASAVNAEDAALARHLLAQTLLLSGRNADAAQAFVAAADAWSGIGDANRALAARAGQVYVLVLAGSNQAVLDASEPPERLSGSSAYMQLRVEQERCLALQNLSRLDEADRCFTWVLAGYRRLREDADYFNGMQGYAGIKRDRGDFDGAQRLFEQSLRDARGITMHSTRGRNLLSLADLSLRRGEVAHAMQHLNAALEEYTLFKSARGQGNVFLKLADVYGELGSYDEAYAALAQAMQRFSARDDAPRIAAAILSFATLERLNGHPLSALAWAAAAETMYRDLRVPGRVDTARLLSATLRVDGELAAPDLPLAESVPAEDAGQWRLLRARLALAQGKDDVARVELEQLDRMPLRLSDRVQVTILGAERRAAGGDLAGAQALLLDEAARIAALAARARSDVLRFVIALEDGELRRTGLGLLLEHDAGSDEALAGVWKWLSGRADVDAGRPASSDPAGDDAFDRAVAGELLVETNNRSGRTGEAAAQRELLARLAGPAGGDPRETAAASVLSLGEFRGALPENAAFAAYVDGGSRAAVLWLTRDAARLLPAPAPRQVRADVLDLLTAAHDAGVSVADVHVAATRLAQDWFGAAAGAPPGRLYVLADPISRNIPWSVLPWPGRASPLLETTAVASVRLARDTRASTAAPSQPHAIRVAISAQHDAADGALPALGGAEVEGVQIRKALGTHDVRVVEDARATRESVGRAFLETGNWIHVAAHGTARPERIGYAGLWLEPAATNSAPTFLSWIDVLDQGVQSDLVVLDACQTGDSGTAVNGYLSFADAVARAGARRVVAVMWPVSDAAAAIWVPAFYGSLLDDGSHDAATALRDAQLRLRASRAFAHPSYWAGMQVIERWPIGSAAAALHAPARPPAAH